MSSAKFYGLLLILFLCTACGEIVDDLTPSGKDQRPIVEEGTTGWSVGQQVPPFTLTDINGAEVELAAALADKQGAVFYFTMWCSTCDGHMLDTVTHVMPNFPDVRFFAVDYLAASAALAKEAASNAGYLNSGFIILADVSRQLERDAAPTMGMTIVVDSSGVIRMNEDYKDGSRLRAVLSSLP